MHPEAFVIFGLSIKWYGVMAALDFMAVMLLAQRNRKHADISKEQVSDIIFVALIAGIIGARGLYVIRFWNNQFANNWADIIRIDKGGQIFYGGFILATIAIIIYCKKKKLSVLRVLDILAPGVALGQAFGRIGCLMNGCCFGKTCDLPWGIKFPEGSMPWNKYSDALLHPVQIYESLENLILAGILFFMIRFLKPGQTAALFLTAYGVMRFLNEMFRGDHLAVDITSGFTPAQVKGLLLIPVGVICFLILQYKKKERHENK